jgi:LEA14-like dessication related protein
VINFVSMLKKVRIGKVLLFVLSIGMILVVMYYVFNPKKAINLVFPGLNEISYVHIDLKKDSSLVRLFVLVQNKMPYKMVIDTIHFEVQLNGFKLVDETIPLKIDQSRFDSDTIELPVHISIKAISELLDDLQGQDSTVMDANFWISYKTIIGNQKVHMNRKIRVATPILTQITLLKLEHKKYNLADKTSEANIKMEIINHGKLIDLQLNAISYNLQMMNTLFSKGIVTQTIDIKPASSLIVDIPVIIEYLSPFKTAWQIVTDNDSLEYDLNIQTVVTVNSFETPYSIPVEVDASGTMELVKNVN